MDRIRIRVRLAQIDKSQRWLAAQLGMDPSLLSKILRGTRPTPPDFDRRLQEALARGHDRVPTEN